MFTLFETTTGTSQAIASTTEMPKFSLYDGNTKRSAARNAASLSAPSSISVNVVLPSTPSAASHCRTRAP